MHNKGASDFLKPARRQLMLPHLGNPCFSWYDFCADSSNEQACLWLGDEALALWPQGRLLLWGPRGVGKTHLLSAFAHGQDVPVINGKDLDFEDVISFMKDGSGDVFVLDNADFVPSEHDLLHLINMLKERRIALLMSASLPPRYWDVDLRDLNSRLISTMSLKIHKPSKELLTRIMIYHLRDKEITMPVKYIHWALKKIPANARDVVDFVGVLDRHVWGSNGHVSEDILRHVVQQNYGHL